MTILLNLLLSAACLVVTISFRVGYFVTKQLGLPVCRAAEERQLFQGRVPEGLRKMETFPTKFMGIAAQDDTEDLSRTAGVLQQAFGMDAESITPQDRREVTSLESPSLRAHPPASNTAPASFSMN